MSSISFSSTFRVIFRKFELPFGQCIKGLLVIYSEYRRPRQAQVCHVCGGGESCKAMGGGGGGGEESQESIC